MKIATFNINSINARMESFPDWLKSEKPDIVLLQEIKAEFNSFPLFDLQSIGYDAKILGQKSYNGVAILSPHKISVMQNNLPGFEDENARYLEAEVQTGTDKVRVASVYAPNGNPPYNAPDDDSKFKYKLKWMEALYNHAKDLLSLNEKVVLGGDFNVILTDKDVYDTKPFLNNALFREEVKQRLTALKYLGFYDAFRALYPDEVGYTFWDYTDKAFVQDLGMRIDYFFLSPMMADKLKSCKVDKALRSINKPSDHTPLVAEFE